MTTTTTTTTAATDAVLVRVPGDKSVSIRALLLTLLADGPCVVRGVPPGRITSHTLDALRVLGATVRVDDGAADGGHTVTVVPPARLNDGVVVDCGGSATLARLMLGLLAGAGVEATIAGSVMLSRRPMGRVAVPLRELCGRDVVVTTDGHLPARIVPGPPPQADALIKPGDSAQVRAAVMFAALAARRPVSLWSQTPGRRHTEQLLRRLGSMVVDSDPGPDGRLRTTRLEPRPIRAFDLTLPADPSAAAFLQVLAAAAPRALTISGVIVDVERDGLLRVLARAGAVVVLDDDTTGHGLRTATVTVTPGPVLPVSLQGDIAVADLVDEVPVLAALCAVASGPSTLAGLTELRVKESDRLARIADLLRAFGLEAHVDVVDGDDRLVVVPGPLRAPMAPIVTDHDHRIGMTAHVLARLGRAPADTLPLTLDDDGCVDESWPGFVGVIDDVQRRLWMDAPPRRS